MSEKYVTRREGVRLVNETRGIPLTVSTVDKDSCLNRGPVPAAKYGRVDLYTPEEFLRYAETKVKPRPDTHGEAAE